MKKHFLLLFLLASFTALAQRPNVILIYTDDLGYGDLSCYGATKIQTPNLDRLASQGLRFTNGHATSATCTPSRYALLTGQYPWRRGAAILPGDAPLIIPPDKITLPGLFQQAGYRTAVVGKWHLGLGDAVEKAWNSEIKPGPIEIGFDYSFIFPATADRVPTVFIENHRVVGLDTSDPIAVNYQNKIGNEPTGKENPELLKMAASPNHGHNNTIINGIGRIGYMTGGKKARWTDEEMPLTFLLKAEQFIEENKQKPFFLFYSLTEPHVPRMPSTLFKGRSQLGYRGDAILQMDWAVGEIMKQLDHLGLAKNTLILFSSDNGPVLDDGYEDEAVIKNNGHTPAGPLRGGKYSAFEGGTRVPWIVRWPAAIQPAVSDALLSQVDLLASFAQLLRRPLKAEKRLDSENLLPTLLGKTKTGRSMLVTQGGALGLIKDGWKYIRPNKGIAYNQLVGIELGNASTPQLYDLKHDIGEQQNLAEKYLQKLQEMEGLLQKIVAGKQ